jgi:hypothetical protein
MSSAVFFAGARRAAGLLAAVFPVVFLAAAFLAAVELGDTNDLSCEGLPGAARPVPVNSRTDIVARREAKPRTA